MVLLMLLLRMCVLVDLLVLLLGMLLHVLSMRVRVDLLLLLLGVLLLLVLASMLLSVLACMGVSRQGHMLLRVLRHRSSMVSSIMVCLIVLRAGNIGGTAAQDRKKVSTRRYITHFTCNSHAHA